MSWRFHLDVRMIADCQVDVIAELVLIGIPGRDLEQALDFLGARHARCELVDLA